MDSENTTMDGVRLGLSIEEMEDDRPVYVQAVGRIVELEGELAECRKKLAAADELLMQSEAREEAVIRECVPPEWVGEDDGQGPNWCPSCMMLEPDGHTEDCIHTLLKLWQVEPGAALEGALEQARAEGAVRVAKARQLIEDAIEDHELDPLGTSINRLLRMALAELNLAAGGSSARLLK